MKPFVHTFHVHFYPSHIADDGDMIIISGGHHSCETAGIRLYNHRQQIQDEGTDNDLYDAIMHYCNEHGRDPEKQTALVYYCDERGAVIGVELFESGDVLDLLPIAMNTMTAFYR